PAPGAGPRLPAPPPLQQLVAPQRGGAGARAGSLHAAHAPERRGPLRCPQWRPGARDVGGGQRRGAGRGERRDDAGRRPAPARLGARQAGRAHGRGAPARGGQQQPPGAGPARRSDQQQRGRERHSRRRHTRLTRLDNGPTRHVTTRRLDGLGAVDVTTAPMLSLLIHAALGALTVGVFFVANAHLYRGDWPGSRTTFLEGLYYVLAVGSLCTGWYFNVQ